MDRQFSDATAPNHATSVVITVPVRSLLLVMSSGMMFGCVITINYELHWLIYLLTYLLTYYVNRVNCRRCVWRVSVVKTFAQNKDDRKRVKQAIESAHLLKSSVSRRHYYDNVRELFSYFRMESGIGKFEFGRNNSRNTSGCWYCFGTLLSKINITQSHNNPLAFSVYFFIICVQPVAVCGHLSHFTFQNLGHFSKIWGNLKLRSDLLFPYLCPCLTLASSRSVNLSVAIIDINTWPVDDMSVPCESTQCLKKFPPLNSL